MLRLLYHFVLYVAPSNGTAMTYDELVKNYHIACFPLLFTALHFFGTEFFGWTIQKLLNHHRSFRTKYIIRRGKISLKSSVNSDKKYLLCCSLTNEPYFQSATHKKQKVDKTWKPPSNILLVLVKKPQGMQILQIVFSPMNFFRWMHKWLQCFHVIQENMFSCRGNHISKL